jgi:hypothetical protein
MDHFSMKKQASPPQNPQSGSIFFWIFAMIFLFGALSFAMIQSGRQGASNLSAEKAKLAATEILEYADKVRGGYKKLLIDGVPDWKISAQMEREAYHTDGSLFLLGNDDCTDDSCKIFKSSGGGVSERSFPEYGVADPTWQAGWTHPGTIDFVIAQVDGVGSSTSDIIMRLPQTNMGICTEVNKMMGLGTDPIAQDGDGGTFYDLTGDVEDKLTKTDMYVYGVTEPRISGKRAFCSTSDRSVILVIHGR